MDGLRKKSIWGLRPHNFGRDLDLILKAMSQGRLVDLASFSCRFGLKRFTPYIYIYIYIYILYIYIYYLSIYLFTYFLCISLFIYLFIYVLMYIYIHRRTY